MTSDSDLAEISSLTTALTEMKGRVTSMADRYHTIERDDIAGELYEVERSIRMAERRLEAARRAID